MKDWRRLLSELGLAAGRPRPQSDAGQGGAARQQPDAVEPGEVALILLKNALRLLDQSSAPSEVMPLLKAAISELEEHVARRAR
jgi:hypothetical protein